MKVKLCGPDPKADSVTLVEAAGVTQAGEGIDGIRWNILGQT
ncbi:MAG: hypothetical protein QOC83_574, partial [Pseudonocardiales bacterium]|nr:hypothetical protein [Pseudonocardiales bacterium]